MFGISAQVHDLIFSVGALVILTGMIPQIMKGTVIPLSSCLLTGGVLFIFALNYFTMKYWYITVVESLNVLAWVVLTRRAWSFR